MAHPARDPLQPWQLALRHGRRYQWARRAFLTFSVLWIFAVPLWHLKRLLAESAGLADRSRFAGLAQALPWPAGVPGSGAPASLSFFGLDFVDPMFSLSVATAGVGGWALAAAAVVGVVLVLALGRFFCGWACPYLPLLSASHATRRLFARVGLPLPDLRLPRQVAYGVLFGVILASAYFGLQWAPLIYPPTVIGREVFRAMYFGSLSAASLAVLAAFVFDTFVSRAGFCRSVCPGGAMFSLLATVSPIRLTLDKAKCTDCTACDVICNLGQKPMSGRVDGGCERCGRCIAVCPTQALAFKLTRPVIARSEKDLP
jgi:ferredoxin-type protein NapH